MNAQVKRHKLIRVAVEGHGPTATATLTEVRVRGHSFVVDEPVSVILRQAGSRMVDPWHLSFRQSARGETQWP